MEKTAQFHDKFPIYDDHLETFSLLWINGQVNKDEKKQNIEKKLRAIINHVKIFEVVDECQRYIQAMPKEDRFVVIVNEQFGEEFVPTINHLPQVSSIYIYCAVENVHKQWTKHFPKIRAVTNHFDEILIQLEVDQKVQMKIEESLSIKPFDIDTNVDPLKINFDKSCVHFQMLINILLRMRFNNEDRNELITLCKKQYKGNKNQLADICEFQHHYSPNRALEWYIHTPFLQKILNKAFLMENIHILYLFRSFIQDIFHQLRCNSCQSSVRVYKGQLISKNQLNNLKKSIGKLISVNSLLLTATDRDSVLYNLKETTPSNNIQQVLFEIDADPQVDVSVPFAKVNSNDGLNNENEILFMAGSIFRLVSIYHDKNKMCVIQMTLCGNKEPNTKKLSEYMKNEYGYGPTNLLSLGMVLRDIGKFDLAKKYLFRMLSQLPPNDRLLDALYPSLGLVEKDRGNYDKCLYWYHKSLKNYMVTRQYDYITIADTYNTIGMIYHANKNQHEKALDCYNKAVLLFKQFHAEMHPMMAIFYDNIGAIHEEQKSYSEALVFYQKPFDIRKKYLPANHLQLCKSYKNVAAAHGYLGSYDMALEYYKKALQIQQKTFPLQHPDIALTYANMAAIYAANNRSQQALTYWHKAIHIFHSTLLPQHPLVIKVKEEIRRVSFKLVYYSPLKKIERKRATPA